MTEIAGATCPTCTSVLTPGAPCPRCASGPHAVPFQHGGYTQGGYPAPYQHVPYQQLPYQPGAYQPAPYQPAAYQPAPYQAGPYAQRPNKSAGVAILLTLLWIGAGHLYLDRIGTGLVLMGAHFVVGLILAVIFFPLGFLVWLAAAIACSVWCSNLAGRINAGTVPPRETW